MKTNLLFKHFSAWALAASILAGCGAAPMAAPAGSMAESAAAPAAAYDQPASQQVAPGQAEQAQGMYFQDYGVNGFVETAQDNLSTFAVDVDTGAYTVARNYVTDGALPPADAVRVEEFVNYFNYHYPYPKAEETFSISMDGAPSPFTVNPNARMLRIGIQGYDIPADQRKDVALTFVIDVSGSMDMENRLGLAKRSLELLVNQLRPSDAVAIVVYGSTARVVLPMTSAANTEAILAGINQLRPDGSTNAEAGLRLGYDLAWKAYNPVAINRVVLLSDGVANVGETGPEAILETIGQYASQGIMMTTVGMGMGNYNDVLMEQLADKGDGFYAYVDDIDEARRIFVDELTSTLQTIGKDAKVQVEFNPEAVSRYRLVGYENRDVADNDFRNDEVDAGEVGAGHSVTALYELELLEGSQETQATLATVHLRWQEMAGGDVIEIEKVFTAGDLAQAFTATAPRFQLAVTVAEYGELLRDSEWGHDSTLDMILTEAQRISDQITSSQGADADVTEFVDLVWRANKISGAQARSQ